MSKCSSVVGVCLLACLASGTAQTLPNATSPEAGVVKSGGQDQWRTTLLIQSEKPYWFIKSAEIADPVSGRVCQEDTSGDKSASRLVLSDIVVEYPMPRRQNGDFNVIVTPQAGYDKSGMTRCTYSANLRFFHGSKPYSVKNTFVFNFGPGKDFTKEKPDYLTPKTVSTPPTASKQPVKKMEPVKSAKEKAKAVQTKTMDKAKTKDKVVEKTKVDPKKMEMTKKVPDVKMPPAKMKEPAKPETPEKKSVKTAEVKSVVPSKVEPPKKAVPETPKTEEPKAEPPKVKPAVPSKVEPPKKAVPETPKTSKVPKTAEPATNKVFQPEDMPEPEKVEVSEEAKVALAQPVKEVEKKPATTQAKEGTPLKQGLTAYEAGKLEDAVKFFSKVAVPKTKQRGVPEREAYVEANFYKGLAAQKLGDLKQAIKSYQEVLKYEKYHPVVTMNLGICYLEMRQYAKANKAFRNVERDQNRIPPEQYDDVMQRARYFWAVTWTRMYRASDQPDRKSYYRRQALAKWNDYKTWYGEMEKYSKANSKAEDYIATMQ